MNYTECKLVLHENKNTHDLFVYIQNINLKIYRILISI